MKYQEREKVTERNQMAGKASPANQYFWCIRILEFKGV